MCALNILYKMKTHYLKVTYTWGPREGSESGVLNARQAFVPAWRFRKEEQKLFKSYLKHLLSCVVLDEVTR